MGATVIQPSFADVDAEYADFVAKFRPKRTTDDCYTPGNVYEAVLGWAVSEYGLQGREAVRPFWPGGDYEAFPYPEGCVVIDNPPFSIISRIVRTYVRHGIGFFLFAPYLTNLSTRGCNHVITGNDVTYENGAVVRTSFVTSLGEWKVRSAPVLHGLIDAAERENTGRLVKPSPARYRYPSAVLKATDVGMFSRYGVDFRLREEDVLRIDALDEQRAAGKKLYGYGYLLTEDAAALREEADARACSEKAARQAAWGRAADDGTIVLRLTERERDLQRRMAEPRCGAGKP